MTKFNGFTSSEIFTQFPDSIFNELLKAIDDVNELKVTLYAIWRIDHIEGPFRALCETDFETDDLGLTLNQIQLGLEKAQKRGTLLRSENDADVFYFLNSPRGRLAAEAFSKGDWRGSAQQTPRAKSNLFKLYEENIGALTPLISDMLNEAEKEYSAAWFEEAFEIAAKKNVRNWKYIEAILKRWKEKGKNESTDQTDSVQDAKRYTDSEFSEFIQRD